MSITADNTTRTISRRTPATAAIGALGDVLGGALDWRNADDGFWVASRDGSFIGTVDDSAGRCYVRNTFGEYLGEYRDLRSAQARLEEWAAAQRAGAPLAGARRVRGV